ncbi:segregation/condensation protein A [bacterium]|nr:segregation/condensation protein A [bacterium]
MENETKKYIDDRCRVHLEMFEGPLDLLLYLIRRDEIDIYDIPITYVVKEYTTYLDKMEALDLSLAGEYLLMAALLMNIKARMLIPNPELDVEEIDDPRTELVEMLVEYKLYKKVSDKLFKFREEQENLFPKGSYPDSKDPSNYTVEELASVDLYSLFRSAWEMLKRENLILPGYESGELDVEERMNEIRSMLTKRKKARFLDLFDGPITIMIFVATFIALLELVREKVVKIHQRDSFSDIWLFHKEEGKLE